ncbi:exodeoxyribonuclease III [Candidatus Kaiserbacteria bacterium RIFCSPHIGHO2_02_FULL_50_50]|uniref:Exodeoxyribonuclease III n=1 Tax=Candidatus Kaiserbacteria bacterium RIFCSPHIGHO2_02_FULL_50_50 TaxID=1798492 RepID=A0A1F6DC29_9BACT|nr:MAG: exodeoxyribonuclease III [Candidatus Kaiserbacteria bacterium RIFCSPHIGHO2_02_FULL_50_50]OGG88065.1 MAG: exodeoxyribonuclease III [Candidatus Kaiserbacteria bacterium RIFCSPLOWO2_12_FULL_50_10]
MKIYSWNVNGIRSVLSKGALQSFLMEHKPDVLCLQETKAEKAQVPVDFPDYYEYWYSADKKGYSGTAIFTKEQARSVTYGIPEEFVKLPLEDTYGNLNREGRVIAVELQNFYVVSVYTPNSKGDLSRLAIRSVWDDAFRAYMKHLDSSKSVIFCGDLNVAHQEDDLAQPKQNVGKHGFTNEERAGITAHLTAGFTDTFRMFTQGNGHYSWWSNFGKSRERNVGWRIDYVLVSNRIANSVKSAAIHPTVFGSDHCPVSIEML